MSLKVKVILSARPSSRFSNIFSSETTRPIEVKFHMEPTKAGGKVSLFGVSRSDDQDGRHAHIW